MTDSPAQVVPRHEKRLFSDYRAPSTPVQQLLVTMWQQHLNVDPIGVDDNFFELGGHSLLAAELLVETEIAVGVRVPARTLYLDPTIAAMAGEIDRLRGLMLVTVDRDRCVGSATCIVVAPGRFELDEHDQAAPAEPALVNDAQLEQAVRMCPTGAISARPAGAADPADSADSAGSDGPAGLA